MIGDWIQESTATTGTGTINLGGAVTGFTTFASQIPSGAYVPYEISDGGNWEQGLGLFTAGSPSTLQRTYVQKTLVSGTYTDAGASAISLSGSAVVMCAANSATMFEAQGSIPLAVGALTGKYITDKLASANGTQAISANALYLQAFEMPCRAVISGIAIGITSGASGAMAVGLYQCIDYQTLALIAQPSSTFNTSTTGVQSKSFSSNIALNPGSYYFAYNANSAPTFRADGAGGYGVPGAIGIGGPGANGAWNVVFSSNALYSYSGSVPSSVTISSSNGWTNILQSKPRFSLVSP